MDDLANHCLMNLKIEIKLFENFKKYFFERIDIMDNKNRYTPKETLGLLLLANENASFKEMDNLILSLEYILLQKKTKSEILEKVDTELLSQIENYWELKKSQVIAYGYLVFNHFRISNEELNAKNITKTYIEKMKLYSPDNAVEFVKRNFNVDLEVKDNE